MQPLGFPIIVNSINLSFHFRCEKETKISEANEMFALRLATAEISH